MFHSVIVNLYGLHFNELDKFRYRPVKPGDSNIVRPATTKPLPPCYNATTATMLQCDNCHHVTVDILSEKIST